MVASGNEDQRGSTRKDRVTVRHDATATDPCMESEGSEGSEGGEAGEGGEGRHPRSLILGVMQQINQTPGEGIQFQSIIFSYIQLHSPIHFSV